MTIYIQTLNVHQDDQHIKHHDNIFSFKKHPTGNHLPPHHHSSNVNYVIITGILPKSLHAILAQSFTFAVNTAGQSFFGTVTRIAQIAGTFAWASDELQQLWWCSLQVSENWIHFTAFYTKAMVFLVQSCFQIDPCIYLVMDPQTMEVASSARWW